LNINNNKLWILRYIHHYSNVRITGRPWHTMENTVFRQCMTTICFITYHQKNCESPYYHAQR
jgi:hypothetical protein